MSDPTNNTLLVRNRNERHDSETFTAGQNDAVHWFIIEKSHVGISAMNPLRRLRIWSLLPPGGITNGQKGRCTFRDRKEVRFGQLRSERRATFGSLVAFAMQEHLGPLSAYFACPHRLQEPIFTSL
jgi:hypothetical protein